MTCEELSSLVMQNRDSIAFLVGNGIHNYDCYEKHVSGKVNWKELIDKVREGISINKTPRHIKETHTLPEEFDTIVYEKTKATIEREIVETTQYLSSLINSLPKYDVPTNICYNEFAQTIGISTEKCNHVRLTTCYNSESLELVKDEIIKRLNIILKSVGISYNPSSFDALAIAQHIAMHGTTDDYASKQIVKTIFADYTLQDWILPFLNVAKAIQTPILTTNYDTSLSKKVHLNPRIAVGANNKTQEGFPFETYFAPFPIIRPWDSFGIWHIHGLYNYVNSIRIGHLDYENLQREIQARLNKTTNPLTDNHWDSNNSWLSVVFRKNLFIMGLGLERDEDVLWWLLKERAKYGLKGWYVCIEDINNEKTENLQNVGLNVIKVNNIDLYENVWKNLLNKLDVCGTDK